ncbi:unnamed protein product [Closterium sp. NIES-53]
MHNGASRANRLRAPASVRTAVFYAATLDSRSAAALAHCRLAVLAGHLSAVLARLLYAMVAGGRPCCAVGRPAALVAMVDPVASAGIADTLEARLADVRKRHEDVEYRPIPWAIAELGIRAQWATEHPSRLVSPQPVQNKGGIDNEVDVGARRSTAAVGTSHADVDGRRHSPLRSGGGLSVMTHVTAGRIAPTYGYFKFSTDRITVAPLQGRRDLITWRESMEPQLEVAGLKGFADGTVPTPPVDAVELHGEFRAAHLLTFMVISRCCSPVVQLARRSCRERLDAGHQAWHFILSTYQILAEMRMAGVEYSTASYITHVLKGLARSYNLMKRMTMVPGTRESLDEDSLTSYILQDEAMQEVKQPTELLPLASYAAPMKPNRHQEQREKPGRGGSGWGWSTKDVDEKRSTRDKGRGGGGRWRECLIRHDPDHLSCECPDRDDSDEDDTKGGRGRSTSRRPRRDAKSRKEKQTSKNMSSTKDVDNSSDKSRGDGEASCSMVGVVEPTVSLALEAGEEFQTVAAAVQANPMAVLLDNGCSHHLMGTKAVFVDMAPSDDVKHVRGFNGALQPVEGGGTVALQGEARKRVLIPDVLYILGVQANRLFADQLKESKVQLHGDGDEMLLVAATGKVLGQARYNERILCTDLLPCSTRSSSTEVVALRTIISATKSTLDRFHARLVHVGVDTIKSSANHEVATGLNIKPSTGADPPCVSCVGGKLAGHTFSDKGSDAEEALAVVHIDLCRPFWVAAKDGSLYFLLLKDRHTQFVWVMPQAKKLVLMLCSDRGGEFLGKDFTDFVDGKGIVHDLSCPYTPQQNGMAEQEMRIAIESVRTMLLDMGVQHHWWHLALRQAIWVRNCLERSTTPPGTTPYQLLTEKKPDLTLARVWGCMVQFMVPEQQRGGKLVPKAHWGLHLGVSPESKGWEVLNLTNNKVVISVEVIFYETLSLEVWKAKRGTTTGRTQAHPRTDTSTASVPLLTEVDKPADEDVVEVLPPSPVLAPPSPVVDRPALTSVSATGNEGSLEASPVALASGIACVQHGEPVEQEAAAGVQSTEDQQTGLSTMELSKSARKEQPVEGSKQLVDDEDIGEEGEQSAGEGSIDSDVVELPITKLELRRTGRARRLPKRLSFHAYLLPAAFTTEYDEIDDDLLYDDAEEDEELPKLDLDMHADPEHRWVIATMTVKEAMALEGALVGVLLGAGWKKSQIDEVLYFKAGDNGVTCWVLVYVDNLLVASNSPAMLKELKERLEAAFKLREISPVVNYLRLEIMRDRPARKLWLHQQGYADKLRRRFIDEEQGGRVPKTLVSIDTYAELTFNDKDGAEE